MIFSDPGSCRPETSTQSLNPSLVKFWAVNAVMLALLSSFTWDESKAKLGKNI